MIAILFRKLPDFGVTNLYAIVCNYMCCFVLGSIMIGKIPIHADILQETWFPYALFLSMLFIVFFNVNAYTIQKVGMIVTSIFQKLSLVFPVIIGLVFYHEAATVYKIVGIILSMIAIVLINISDKSDMDVMEKVKKYWYWPFLVLMGSGIIEVLLFYVEVTNKVNESQLAFVTTLFFLAGCWGLIYMIISRKLGIKKQDLIAGIAIGIPNFFTIYLLIYALKIGWQGSVLFPINNLGVIIFISIIGIIYFKEKLIPANYLGLAMALIAVVFISI